MVDVIGLLFVVSWFAVGFGLLCLFVFADCLLTLCLLFYLLGFGLAVGLLFWLFVVAWCFILV